MKELLTDIQNRLLAEVPELKYVDMDWGQLDFYNPHPPVKFPCALIDINSVQWSNVLKKGQMGLATTVITVADLRLSNTSGAAPQSQKDKAMEIFDVLEKIHIALHGWTAHASYTSLIRQTNTLRRREDGVKFYQITFTTEVKDDSAIPQYSIRAATPNVTIDVL